MSRHPYPGERTADGYPMRDADGMDSCFTPESPPVKTVVYDDPSIGTLPWLDRSDSLETIIAEMRERTHADVHTLDAWADRLAALALIRSPEFAGLVDEVERLREGGKTKRDSSGDSMPIISKLLDSAQISTLPRWAMQLFCEGAEHLISERQRAEAAEARAIELELQLGCADTHANEWEHHCKAAEAKLAAMDDARNTIEWNEAQGER